MSTPKTSKQKHQRARNVDEIVVREVLSVLDGWTDKLTWDSLITVVEQRTRQLYTRQTLSGHERIQQAFAVRKKALLGASGDADKPAEADSIEQQVIRRLEAQVQRLEAENSALLEKFVVWAYNARIRGLDEQFLSQALPRVHRQQTKVS